MYQCNWKLQEGEKTPHLNAQISANGHVQNLPGNMLTDQFGVAGLAVGRVANYSADLPLPDNIAAEETEKFRKEHEGAQGTEKSSDTRCSTHSGPIVQRSEPSVFTQEPDETVPAYQFGSRMMAENPKAVETLRKAPFLQPEKFSDEIMFLMFFNITQDAGQIAAAKELYRREWRYHKDAKTWLRSIPSLLYKQEIDVNGNVIEHGVYEVVSNKDMRVERMEWTVDFSRIEGEPQLLQPPAENGSEFGIKLNGMPAIAGMFPGF